MEHRTAASARARHRSRRAACTPRKTNGQASKSERSEPPTFGLDLRLDVHHRRGRLSHRARRRSRRSDRRVASREATCGRGRLPLLLLHDELTGQYRACFIKPTWSPWLLRRRTASQQSTQRKLSATGASRRKQTNSELGGDSTCSSRQASSLSSTKATQRRRNRPDRWKEAK